MTFDAIWEQLCRKNPSLSKGDSTVEFKSDNLKILLRQVYDQGVKSVPKADPAKNSFDSIFDDFGDVFKSSFPKKG